MSTYRLQVIVLARRSFKESDILVTVYSQEKGKLELVARGAKKFTSKISGHIEPITQAEIMVVPGKNYAYLGAVESKEAYLKIKSDYFLTIASGSGINLFNNLVNIGEQDWQLYQLLISYLDILNSRKISDPDLFYNFFALKLLIVLGYAPFLSENRTGGGIAYFDISQGCLVGKPENNMKNILTISENSLNFLRRGKDDLDMLWNIEGNNDSIFEFKNIICSLISYIN
jgi:DNA repair protein RecO (recombination protein O)